MMTASASVGLGERVEWDTLTSEMNRRGIYCMDKQRGRSYRGSHGQVQGTNPSLSCSNASAHARLHIPCHLITAYWYTRSLRHAG